MRDLLQWLTDFFANPYARHMEAEIAYLRGQNARLQLKLEEALTPREAIVTTPREFPQFAPVRTSWDSYLAAQIAKQEAEEQDGTHSS